MSASQHDDRRRWEDNEEERGKHREETLLQKDKEREMDAIKVCV